MERTCKIEAGTAETAETNAIEEIEYSYERLNFIR